MARREKGRTKEGGDKWLHDCDLSAVRKKREKTGQALLSRRLRQGGSGVRSEPWCGIKSWGGQERKGCNKGQVSRDERYTDPEEVPTLGGPKKLAPKTEQGESMNTPKKKVRGGASLAQGSVGVPGA